MTDGPTHIELAHCSLIFDNHRALDDVSFRLRRGERWALVGPNGSGKTQLLKMLRGDVWPTPIGSPARRYCFDGEVSSQPAGMRRYIAYVGPERQDKYVRYGWNPRVSEVVATGLFDEDIPLTQPSAAQRARVSRVLVRFGLWRLRERRMLTLSYGQRRLALIARAFVSDAQVLLLDEPFNGLDARAKETLRRALAKPRAGRDWVVASHRPDELPANVTHVARIEAGRIVESGPRRARGEGRPPRRPNSARKPASSGTPDHRRVAAPFIALRNVSVYRDDRRVIRELTWTVERGEHWAVLGANGSGKSTLLNLLYGDLHPALGGVVTRAGFPRGARIEQWKRRVGWVSPELQADHSLAKSIEEIVISGRYASVGLNAPPTRRDRTIARRWLEFFDVEHLRERGPRQASYGQMRMALFARAMTNDPELLLLDEPCSGLDGETRSRMLTFIERLARRGTQVVMAVHDASDIVPAITQVLKIRRGGGVAALELETAGASID